MALSFVQATNAANAAGTTSALAFTSNVTVGSLLLVSLRNDGALTTSVSDTIGNVWVNVNGTGNDPSIWYTVNKTTGANTVTGTYSSSNSNNNILVAEYSNPLASPLDGFVGAGSTTTWSVGPLTTHFTNETLIIILLSFGGGSTTSTSGATLRVDSNTGGKMSLLDINESLSGAYTQTGTLGIGTGIVYLMGFKSSTSVFVPVGGDSISSDRSIQHLTTELNHFLQV